MRKLDICSECQKMMVHKEGPLAILIGFKGPQIFERRKAAGMQLQCNVSVGSIRWTLMLMLIGCQAIPRNGLTHCKNCHVLSNLWGSQRLSLDWLNVSNFSDALHWFPTGCEMSRLYTVSWSTTSLHSEPINACAVRCASRKL